MAGISEPKAEAAARQGKGFARHLGVRPGTERYDAIVYGTKRAKGWKPSREARRSLRGAYARRKEMRRGG